MGNQFFIANLSIFSALAFRSIFLHFILEHNFKFVGRRKACFAIDLSLISVFDRIFQLHTSSSAHKIAGGKKFIAGTVENRDHVSAFSFAGKSKVIHCYGII